MNCPACGSVKYKKNGKTSNGLYARYKCSDCGKNWSDSPNKRGGQVIGDQPMTAAERKRRSRAMKSKK